MATVTVIAQSDLLTALGYDFKDARGIRDWPDELTPELDPEGVMLVLFHMLHNDGPDYRVVGLAKVKSDAEAKKPVEVTFTIPGFFATRLLQTMQIEKQA